MIKHWARGSQKEIPGRRSGGRAALLKVGGEFALDGKSICYLSGKGVPPRPASPIPDLIDWTAYTGNRLHLTQTPFQILTDDSWAGS